MKRARQGSRVTEAQKQETSEVLNEDDFVIDATMQQHFEKMAALQGVSFSQFYTQTPWALLNPDWQPHSPFEKKRRKVVASLDGIVTAELEDDVNMENHKQQQSCMNTESWIEVGCAAVESFSNSKFSINSPSWTVGVS